MIEQAQKALKLFQEGSSASKIACAKSYPPDILTEEMMDFFAAGFDSVEICDSFCIDLFVKNKWALHKTVEWAKSPDLYTKRAAFIMMGALARDNPDTPRFVFRVFMPIMIRESTDERTAVKEAIQWASKEVEDRLSKT